MVEIGDEDADGRMRYFNLFIGYQPMLQWNYINLNISLKEEDSVKDIC